MDKFKGNKFKGASKEEQLRASRMLLVLSLVVSLVLLMRDFAFIGYVEGGHLLFYAVWIIIPIFGISAANHKLNKIQAENQTENQAENQDKK